MKIGFFSPLPPSKSGIADYSAALLESLGRIASVQTFTTETTDRSFDIGLYQIGNNGYHEFAYRQAMRQPGVVVLHESNLHHLLAEITIKKGDWDAYMQAVELEGTADDIAFAQRVRALEVGPNYDGLPMLKQLLASTKGVIVHSHFAESDVRRAGFEGPIGVIPHGAWIPDTDRMGYRGRLGLGPETPLIGVFGFLKPYKRITESLRAFRRLLRVQPNARMILVGEPHPDFPLRSIIDGLGLSESVRILGFTPIEDFVGYIAACDIILNLRWPTVGESSGTLLRSLGLGKAVIVSNVGSFQEYPDGICLKVPVDTAEEDTIFEYLNLLVSRPDLARELGAHARAWVARECNWDSVARKYVDFLESVHGEKDWVPSTAEPVAPEPAGVIVEPAYIASWAATDGGRSYVQTHSTRLVKTLEITPKGGPGKRILEMGSYLQITPALKTKLEYEEVRGCYYGALGRVDSKEVVAEDGSVFTCEVDHFDAERDAFPYPDAHFNTVLCCELLEHLPGDPMHMMSEINRILVPGGSLVLTTPNIASFRAISAILQGYHPGFFPAYIRPAASGEETEARHNREYAPREIIALFRDGGFETVLLETGEFRDEPHPEHEWVRHMLDSYKQTTELRGDGIYAVGRKQGPVRERFPTWLYS